MRKKHAASEEKNKSGIRFRALDFVIIILVILVVVGVYFRYNILDMLTGNKNLSEYTVSFEIKDIQYKTENYINVGDKVYYYDSGDEIGTIITASTNSDNALIRTPAIKSFVPDGGNQAVEVAYPENTRIDASGRIQCKGSFSEESGFLLGGTDSISPGDVISVKTALVTVDIIVTDIVASE